MLPWAAGSSVQQGAPACGARPRRGLEQVQRQEALELHGLPPDRVVVTGAQCYDQWFDRAPSRSRQDFCARVGLDPARPFVLYTVSSLFRGTVSDRHRGGLDPRAADQQRPAAQGIGILIRPHPARLDDGAAWTSRATRTGVLGAHPVDDEAKDDYFDSCTTAPAWWASTRAPSSRLPQWEAGPRGDAPGGVARQPGRHAALPLSADRQRGSLARGAPFDEHVAMLAESLAPAGGGDEKAARFVEGFVRPYGRGEAATPRFVAAVEEAATVPLPARERRSIGAWLAFVAMYPLASALALHLRSQPWRKRTRHRLAKQWDRQRTLALRRIKQFAIDPPGRVRQAAQVRHRGGRIALTPKTGRQRDPQRRWRAPTCARPGTRVSWSPSWGAAAGRSSSGPGCRRPGSSCCTGFRFSRGPKRTATSTRPGWWWCPAAEPPRGTATSPTTTRRSFPSIHPTSSARATKGASTSRKAARSTWRSPPSIARSGPRGAQARREGCRGTAPIADVPALRQLLVSARAGDAHRGVHLVRAFDGANRHRRPPPPSRAIRGRKFYGNAALPSTPENARFVSSYLADLARNNEVVLLNTAQRFDEHADFPKELLGRVHAIDHLMAPAGNLAVQTEVIRHAQAFVGTYGGSPTWRRSAA